MATWLGLQAGQNQCEPVSHVTLTARLSEEQHLHRKRYTRTKRSFVPATQQLSRQAQTTRSQRLKLFSLLCWLVSFLQFPNSSPHLLPIFMFLKLPSALAFNKLPQFVVPVHVLHHTLVLSPSAILQRSLPLGISMLSVSLCAIARPSCSQEKSVQMPLMCSCLLLFRTSRTYLLPFCVLAANCYNLAAFLPSGIVLHS